MMNGRLILIAALLVMSVEASDPAQSVESVPVSNPFVGAWLITEASVTDETGTNVNHNPEPGLYVFTERHFSNMLIPGSERVPFGSNRTDAERNYGSICSAQSTSGMPKLRSSTKCGASSH
jgi:hypothetical protein